MSRKGRRGSKRLKKWRTKKDTYVGRFGNVARFLAKSYSKGAGKMHVSEIEIQRGN